MITKKQLNTVERFADKLWAKVGLDIEFTRHFLDRVNDARNKKQITTSELIRLFRQSFKKYGKKIADLGKDAQAVIKDMETDINMPFVLQLDKNGELDLVAKTVMRKKDFKTPNQQFAVEDVSDQEEGTDELVYKYKKATPSEESKKKNMKNENTDIEQLDESFAIDKGAKVAFKFKNGKMLYGKVIGKEKVMGKPGVEVKWSDGTKGRFSNDQFSALSMDDKADYKINESTELEEATVPFKSLEAAWLRTGGDKKKQARLIKKHDLKPIISNVRPGAVKLGALNKLKAKGNQPHTVAGLDADGELIFVTNNPTKIYYPKKGKSKRPDGKELHEETMEYQRLHKVVSLVIGESYQDIIGSYLSKSSIDLTWTPSQIAESFDKFLKEESWVVYDVKTKKAVKRLKSWNAAKKAKAKDSNLEVASAEEFHDKIQKRKNEEVEVIDEASDYKLYHKAFYSATNAAIELANKRGFEVDEDDWFNQVSTGPKKPGKGKTNSYHIELTKNGKSVKKKLHFQVYGMESGKYELNAYVESAEVEGEELNEAVKWWSVTITKKTGKLSKGQNVEVKAASMAAAIKKGLKQMKVNPTLVPSDAVDAKLAKKQMSTVESNELEEGKAYVTNGKKTYEFDSTSKALTAYDSLGGTSKGWSVVTDPSKVKGTKIIKEAKDDKQKDIESLKKLIKNPDPKRVKQYGGTKYVDMLKKKLARLEEDEDPCWKGYKQLGMKKKNGKDVPNCVPEETELEK